MERFTTLTAVACPLGLANVDTDQLIPARFMKRSRGEGYGGVLLHDLRFRPDGSGPRGFVLDDPRYSGSRILVSRRNFGTGSSREAAVYALWDYGVRCVIAPSFGDIFASNAVKNGLLPAVVTEAEMERLLEWLTSADTPSATVNLDAQWIGVGTVRIPFSVDPVRRRQLLNGWDDIDLTLEHVAEIADYKTRIHARRPWTRPTFPEA